MGSVDISIKPREVTCDLRGGVILKSEYSLRRRRIGHAPGHPHTSVARKRSRRTVVLFNVRGIY